MMSASERRLKRLVIVLGTVATQCALFRLAKWAASDLPAPQVVGSLSDIPASAIIDIGIIALICYLGILLMITACLLLRNVRDWGTIFVPKHLRVHR